MGSFQRRKFLKALAITGGVGMILGTYSVFIERQWVMINHYSIPIKNLPPNFENFTIAHLTDLHQGFLVSENYLRSIVSTTNNLNADLIVCTGDFVHKRNETKEIKAVWPILHHLKAKHGVFTVLGNHDNWADFDLSQKYLNRSPHENLQFRMIDIEKSGQRIWFSGAGDLWTDHMHFEYFLTETPETEPLIMLAHNPDSADRYTPFPISLFMSGHTHGGQVRIPFIGSPIIPVKNKQYDHGLIPTADGKSQIFISKGIGWAILPVRFNCYPEIAVLHLHNADRTNS